MILLKDALDPNRPPTIILHGRQIRMKANVRYLGVYWNTGLTIMMHVRRIKARSTEKFDALAVIVKRDWGLDHECLLTLYKGIFIPVATYAAASCCDKLNKSGLRILEQAQRPPSHQNYKGIPYNIGGCSAGSGCCSGHSPKNQRDENQILDKEKVATERRATSTATCDAYI